MRHWDGAQEGQSYVVERSVSLALVAHYSSDGMTMKISLWGRCFITSTSLLSHLFLSEFAKTKSYFIVSSVETGLRRKMQLAGVSCD